MLSSQLCLLILQNTVDEGLYFNNIEKIMKTIAIAFVPKGHGIVFFGVSAALRLQLLYLHNFRVFF